MRIREDAPLAPSKCGISQRHDGPFLDFHKDWDQNTYGRMYLRVAICKDIGRAVGMVTKEELIEAQQTLQARTDALEAAQARIEELENLLAAVQTLSRNGFAVNGDVNGSDN